MTIGGLEEYYLMDDAVREYVRKAWSDDIRDRKTRKGVVMAGNAAFDGGDGLMGRMHACVMQDSRRRKILKGE